MVKNLPQVQETQETWVWSLGREDPLEREMATHSTTLAWKILGQMSLVGWNPWGWRVEQDWACTYTHTPNARWVWNQTGPCGHPEQGSPSVSPIFYFQEVDFWPQWPSLSSKGQNWIAVNQGREGMQRQGRNSQGTRMESWMKVLPPTPGKGYT